MISNFLKKTIMAENVMLIPNEKSFVLSKVKLVKDGGLDVHYEVTEVSGNESYTNKYHVESAKDIHPDLRKCFERLRPIMGRIFNITSFLSVIESTDFKANKKQQEFARDYADEVLKNIEVRGVSLSGQDDNVGVILTGLYTVSNNMKTAINSPRIKLSSVSFGFEEENARVTFHTYVKVFGQKLPAVIVMDESIYVILRVQVIPDIEYMKNKDEFIRCVNEMNINYKAVKYYLGADNALYLDMYIPNKNDDLDGELVMDLLNAITVHLEKEYPNWMKLLWN